MRFAAIALALSSLALVACGGGPDLSNMTPEQIAAYQQYRAAESAKAREFHRDANEFLHRSNQGYRTYTPPPAAQPIGQPATEVVWCRNLTDQLVRCQ